MILRIILFTLISQTSLAVELIETYSYGVTSHCLNDPCLVFEDQKLLPNDGSDDDEFGFSTSIYGNLALIGARENDQNGNNSGIAYVFEKNNQGWSQLTKLIPDEELPYARFGVAVSINAQWAVVGAHFFEGGLVYIFKNTQGKWAQVDKIIASDGQSNDYFGRAVSLSDQYLLVGAPNNNGSGAAYLYELVNDEWTFKEKLVSSDASEADDFGVSVSMTNDSALIGAPGDDDEGSFSGSAYLYQLINNDWSEVQKLTAFDATSNDSFGRSVSLDANKAVVGAWTEGGDRGAAYVFSLQGNSWSHETKLVADDRVVNGWFGYSVAIDGKRVVVGSYGDNPHGSASGSAYLFEEVDNNWSLIEKIVPDDGAFLDKFGFSVDIYQDQLLIGSIDDYDNGSSSGSSFIYQLDLIFADGLD